MNRAQALHEAQQIGASLLTRFDPPLTGVPISSPPLPVFALPPNEAGERVCRAMTLTAPPGADVFALLGEDWERAGFHPLAWSLPAGPVLVGTRPDGFVLVLTRPGGRDELAVVSPILPPPPVLSVRLFAGIAVGASVGLVGPCFSTAALQSVVGEHVAYLGFVPVVLTLGGILIAGRDTRRFGVGLLIGGAITGIVTAGMCASLLR